MQLSKVELCPNKNILEFNRASGEINHRLFFHKRQVKRLENQNLSNKR